MLQRCILLLLLFCTLTFSHVSAKRKEKLIDEMSEKQQSARKGKLFSLFNIVEFQNSVCTTQMRRSNIPVGQTTTNRMGTCFTNTECSSKGGTVSGNCAAGFGVCCLFLITSGTVTQNCSYLTNVGFPSNFNPASMVTYTINKCTQDVCSLRLDFETFVTMGPALSFETAGGLCVDTLTIMSTSRPASAFPVICGQNTGQHVYIDVGRDATDNAMLTFAFGAIPAGANAPNRMWDIKVTQVKCDQTNPPPGCLQYFTSPTDMIMSFNFAGTNGNLQNQLYTACIRQSEGFCCVQYLPCPVVAMAFSINEVVGQPTLGIIDSACTNDFIQIVGASAACLATNAAQTSRICGTRFSTIPRNIKSAPEPICDCSEPFEVTIRTDAQPDQLPLNTVLSKGVCLTYTQLPCGTLA